MLNRLLFLGLLVCVAGNVQGHERPLGHLKKDNPNELVVLIGQGENCGDSYERIVNNQLIKSRIKKWEEAIGIDIPFLWVSVKCMRLKSGSGYIFKIETAFVRQVPAWNRQPEERSLTTITHKPEYGSYGFSSGISTTENEQFISNTVRECVENSLADYLKTNFDL